MPLKEKLLPFNKELNKFIKELKLWIPLIKLLIISDGEFDSFWDDFTRLHKEKKIYTPEVLERMKGTFLKLRNSGDENYNLNDKELKELLSFSASRYIF